MDKKVLLADTLKRRIISMELAPGAVVDEVSLSDEFGLSRPPVRELIRQMAAEGYLELEANRPVRVSSESSVIKKLLSRCTTDLYRDNSIGRNEREPT